MPGADGEALRAQRRSRGWDVPEMARRLRRAAGDDPLPEHGDLVRMIRRWERSTYRLSERYELLYAAALGVRPDDLRRPGGVSLQPERPQGPHAPGVIAAIGAALHADPAARPADDHAALEREVLRAWELRQSAEYARLGGLLDDLLRKIASGQADPAASVHVCNMASSLLKRLGAYEMAAVAADRAFRAASQSGSMLLVGAAKLRVANVYLSASRHAEAVAVAAAAADDLPPGRSSAPEEVATFGALLLTAAVAAAEMGEAAQAWEFLGHARAATAVCDREHADPYAVFGPVNLAVHGVQVATELGDGREALRRAEVTHPGRLPAVLLERRSTLLIDVARAQHMRRDAAAAGETLLEAERVAPLEVRYSGAARGLLGELLSAGRPAAGLREMADRLNLAA
jgi:transcriptional regulator with XRE-family HTH domain